MAKTLNDVLDDLVPLLGCAVVEELDPGDQRLLRQVVNQAYGQIFTPIDGHRPKWSERHFALQFPAPLEVEVTAVEGERKVVVDSEIPVGTEGAKLRVGGRFYTVASTIAPEGEISLLQPWESATGVYSCTIYFACRAMPADFVQMIGTPTIPDVGVLYALDGQDHETLIRSFLFDDFWPIHNRYRQINYPRRTFEASKSFDTGDPYFFWVDSTHYEGGSVEIAASRLCLYPIPDRRRTVEFRYNFHPQLKEDTSVVRLPAEMVDTIFMPLCREAVAVNFPDYSGRNTELLIREGTKSRVQLKTIARPQRQHKSRIRPKEGW